MNVIQHSGAKMFRLAITRSYKDAHGWEPYDRAFDLAAERGITILPDLGYTSEQFPTQPEFSAWETWVYEVVNRYGYGGSFWVGKSYAMPVNTWEVWNEPNLPKNNPGGTTVQPANFGKFLKRSATAIRAAQQAKQPGHVGTEVLLGGLYLPAGNSQSFLEGAYKEAGVSTTYDGLAIHPYSFSSNHIVELKASLTGIRGVLNSLPSGSSKSLWITELGWPVEYNTPDGRPPVSSAEQASLLTESFDWLKSQSGTLNIQAALWYNYHDIPVENWAYRCGLRKVNGDYLPSWVAFQEETGASSWPAPTTVTGTATSVQASQATLNGSVNPNARQTSYTFEYGPTTGYGHAVPVPSGSAGSGGSVVAESATAVGLLSEMTYHFRIAASNAAGTTFGEDHTFTTADPGLAHSWAIREPASGTQWLYYGKAGSGLVQWGWNGASWNSGTIGGTVATGSTPTITRDPGSGNQWAYYVNGSGSLAQSSWNGSSWSSGTFAGGAAVNSSPSAVIDPFSGNQWVYYVNGSGSLAQWAWNGSSWGSGTFAGSVRAGTSPAAVRAPGAGTQWVYYVNGSGAIALWGWNGSSWENGTIGGSVASNSSPAVEWDPNTGTQWIYYINSTGALAEWSWNGSAWSGGVIGGSAAAGTSPAVVQDQAAKTTWVYYVNNSGGISQWAWNGSKWSNATLGAIGGSVKAGTSPVAIRDPSTGNQWVYYLNVNGGISGWAWNGTAWGGGSL